MKLTVQQDPACGEVEITVRCGRVDGRLAALLAQIQLYAFSVPARREGRSYTLPLERIFYFESVEEKTFAYCEKDVYECPLRLYELEEQLAKTSFVRVGKSLILNTARVESVRPLLSGRLEAALGNGETLPVSRHYVPAFRARFGPEGGVL